MRLLALNVMRWAVPRIEEAGDLDKLAHLWSHTTHPFDAGNRLSCVVTLYR